MLEIRQIKEDEWQLLKNARLAALEDSPEAFTTTFEQARQRTDAEWQKIASANSKGEESYGAIAIEKSQPVGMAVGLPDKNNPIIAYLVAMWVVSSHRGTDTAASILHQIKSWAAEKGANSLIAGVKPANTRAIQFYKKIGFNPYEGDLPTNVTTDGCEVVLELELKNER